MLTLIPHNMLFVLSKRLANMVVCFLLQPLGFHRGIELVRRNFDLMCITIHTLPWASWVIPYHFFEHHLRSNTPLLAPAFIDDRSIR